MKLKALQVGPIGTNCYLLIDEATNKAAIVDPGDEADRILTTFPLRDLEVEYISDQAMFPLLQEKLLPNRPKDSSCMVEQSRATRRQKTEVESI